MRNRKSSEVRDKLNILSLKHLFLQIGISKEEINDVINNFDNHYRCDLLEQKKDDGTIKKRKIYKPDLLLRKILKSIDVYLLKKIKLPEAMHGARKSRSNITNANKHVNKDYVLNLDIKDFYPSISLKDVYNLFRRLNCSPVVAKCLSSLCSRDDHVPQGFNTSSSIGNLILREAIDRIQGLCDKHGLRLSVHVDDITISGNMNPHRLVKTIEKIIVECGFKIKSGKTVCFTKLQQQKVTGVIVNTKINLDKKAFEELRFYLHVCKKYGPSTLIGDITNKRGEKIGTIKTLKNHLIGRLSYLKSINPQKATKLIEISKSAQPSILL